MRQRVGYRAEASVRKVAPSSQGGRRAVRRGRRITHYRSAFLRNPEHHINPVPCDLSGDSLTKTPDSSDSATSSQLDCNTLFPAVKCISIFSWNKNEKIAAESWKACKGNFSYNGINGSLTAATSFSNIWEPEPREISCTRESP